MTGGVRDRGKAIQAAPIHVLAAAVAVALGMAALVIFLAHSQPWMGLRLAYDGEKGAAVVRAAAGPAAAVPRGVRLSGIEGGGERMAFAANDFVVEPDGSLGTYDAYETFLARQARLARIQASPEVVLRAEDGRSWSVRPLPQRPLSTLPPDFWVQVFVGVAAWLISAGIWSFRMNETSARYLLLSGWSTLMFAPFAAVYSTRELALAALPFRILSDLNFLGGSLFAASLASLLLYYPRKLAPRWVGWAVVGVFLAWFAAQEAGLFADMTLARRLLVVVALLATFVLSGVHWRATRRDPVARAALQWFLMSWVVGVAIFVLGVLAPQMFGVDTSGLQGYGFLVFLLVYGGLAFGVVRFRLFDLGEWWMRIMLWTVSVLLLIAFDLAFALGLHLSAGLSLSLALLLCGVVWLPTRGWLWNRLFVRAAVSERAQFEGVVEIALAAEPDRQVERWRALLHDLFDPLHIRAAGPIQAVALEDHGLRLAIPGEGELPALRLEYAHAGRRLFNRRDEARARELAGMLRHVLESRNAYEEGVAMERRRIARDVHDNIGAQLLHALHSGGERKDRLIRETIADLGDIINDASRAASTLDEALGDLRYETAERVEAGGLALDWPLDADLDAPPDPVLVHTVRAVVRETVSNALKHAGATAIRVRAGKADGMLVLAVEDDGRGFDPQAPGTGAGLANLRSRVAALEGRIAWTAGPEGVGTRVNVRLPLAGAGQAADGLSPRRAPAP